ncbi:MAG TPA: ABC transporter permease [Phototrophicaceae bacterium]|jgi:peptide/nickel transport system permease protein|nr:ABC transporter permease [Phototrophicaceae bacterium]
MTTLTSPSPSIKPITPLIPKRQRRPLELAVRRLFSNPSTVIGLILVLAALGCAIFAPLISPYDPIKGDLKNLYVTPPSTLHVFGTDDIGRDILSRVIYGAQISLKLAIAAQTIGLVIGLTIGLITGYFGGWVDTIIMRLVDIVMAFPLLIIAIALIGILGSSEINIIFALGLVSWTVIARIVRSQVLSIKQTEYVTAARSLGATDFTIIVRHILPNILAPVIVYMTLGIGGVILAEASLSFLGLGAAQQATPSWGKMLTESRAFIRSAWWMPFFPGLAILLTVMGFNLLGDGLRDALDVRSK